MTKKLFTTTTLTASILALVVSSVSPAVFAATAPAPQNNNTAGQALEIAPPVINVAADPGQTITTNINLRDVSTTSLIVTGQVNDFTAQGEDGTPKVVLDEGEVNPYSMKTWIRPLPKLTLKAKELKALPVTIAVPKTAAPGGYYAVVRFTAVPPELKDTGVSLSASLGALVFLTVNGQAKEGITVEEFFAEKNKNKSNFFESSPVTFVERLKNTGNIHEQPAGQVTITDMFGKKIAAVNVNLPPRNILPGTIRRFEQNLDKSVIGNKILFGRYKADLKVTYGTQGQSVTDSIVFWVIPWKLIAGAIIGLIILFFIARAGLRRYNENIVRRSRGRRW